MLQLIEYLKNSRLAKISALTVIISLAAIIFLTMAIEKLKPRIIAAQKIAVQKNAIVENYKKSLQEMSGDLKNNIAALNAIRPSEDGIIQFIEDSEKLLEKSQIAAKCLNCQLKDYFSIKHAGSQISGGAQGNSVNYQISLKTDLRDLQEFLKKFEQLPYIINLENLSFSHYDGGGGENVQLKITLFIK